MAEIIDTQPTANAELPPSYDEAEEQRRQEEERIREEARRRHEETVEDCCCYYEEDTFCCLWFLSGICRGIGECTNDCFECLATGCNDCCESSVINPGDSTSIASLGGGCCDCDCDCSD